jgi:kinesin family protein 1
LPKIDGVDVLCVAMSDTETVCTNILADQEEKKFTFDYSFWSHDGFKTRDDGYTEAEEGSNYKD